MREGRRDVVLQESRRFFTAHGNDSAVRQARALTGALGVGIELFEDKLIRDNEKGAARAAHEAAGGGDRNETDENRGYNEAFDQVEAANDLAIFARDLPEELVKSGWTDMSEEEVQAKIDGYYQGQLVGINPDSVYGKLVAGGILKQNAELLKTYRAVQAEKGQQERRIMVTNEVRADYEADKKIDHLKLMERLRLLVPGPGGRKAYLETVFDIAEEFGDEALIDSIPERFPSGDPTGKTDSNFDPLFDAAREKAAAKAVAIKKDRDAKWKLNNQTELAQMHSHDTQLAKAGDASVLPNIEAGGQEGPNGEPRRYLKGDQKTLYDLFANATETAQDDALLLNDWMVGNAIGYSQPEVDRAHLSFVNGVKDNPPEKIKDDPEAIADFILDVSLERATVNGKLPSVYREQMKVNISNPEKFSQAAEMYSMLEAKEPGFAETQIGSGQSSKLYLYNRILADTNGNEEQAIELLKAHQPGRSNQLNTEVTSAVKNATQDLVELKFGPVDYATTAQIEKLASAEVRFYTDMGFDPEVAAEYAVEHIQRRYRRGGDYLWPVDAGWGNDVETVYQWAIENEAAHRGIDPDDLTIIPTADPTRVRFHHSENVVPELQTYPASFFADMHGQSSDSDLQAGIKLYESSTPERLAEAETRAFARRFPHNVYVESGQRGWQATEDRKRWDNMDPLKKQRLIQDELKTME
jgi:hypothetical protein